MYIYTYMIYVLKATTEYVPEERKDLHLFYGYFLFSLYLNLNILPPFILHVLLTIEDFRTWPLFAVPVPGTSKVYP